MEIEKHYKLGLCLPVAKLVKHSSAHLWLSLKTLCIIISQYKEFEAKKV
jgi:hypothetical protein